MSLSEDTIRKFVVQQVVIEMVAHRLDLTEGSKAFEEEIEKRLALHLKLPYHILANKFRRQLVDLHNMNTPGIAQMHLASVAAKEDPEHFAPVLYLFEQERSLRDRF